MKSSGETNVTLCAKSKNFAQYLHWLSLSVPGGRELNCNNCQSNRNPHKKLTYERQQQGAKVMLVNIQMLKMQIRHWAELIIIARIYKYLLCQVSLYYFFGVKQQSHITSLNISLIQIEKIQTCLGTISENLTF